MDRFIPKYTNAQVIEELKRGNNEVAKCFFYWKGLSIKELNDMERRAPGSTRNIIPPICATVYRGLIKVMTQLFRDEGFEYSDKVSDFYLELLEKDKLSKIDDPEKLEAWTIKTARNFFIDSIRRSNGQKLKTVLGADLSHLLVEDTQNEAAHQWIYKAIDQLSAEDQDLIRKLFFTPHEEKNKEYRQKLAQQMGIPVPYFYTKTSRALERLLRVATRMLGQQAIRDKEYAQTNIGAELRFEQYSTSSMCEKQALHDMNDNIQNDAQILARMAVLFFDNNYSDDDNDDKSNLKDIYDSTGDNQCEAFILSDYLSEKRIRTIIAKVKRNSPSPGLELEGYGELMTSLGLSVRRINSNLSSLKDYLMKGQRLMAIIDYGKLVSGEKSEYYQSVVCMNIQGDYIHIYDPNINGERDFILNDFAEAWLQTGNFLIIPQIPASFYEPHPLSISDVQIKEDLEELVDLMAKNNHEIWAEKKVQNGWRYGPFLNEERQTNPNIAPFNKISQVAKEIDKLSAIRSIKVIQKMGYRIVRKSPYFCRSCGETVEYGMKFCPECGTKLGNE